MVIVDYGIGNVRNVERALQLAGAEPELSADPAAIVTAGAVVLPGVGAFASAAERLRTARLSDAVREAAARGVPLLGVCLGMQLLFEESEESPGIAGLGLLPGSVVRMHPSPGKVPHMGWNTLRHDRESSLLQRVPDGSYAYFVHSYIAETEAELVVSSSDHGGRFAAAVQRGNVCGTQFHPEKSGALAAVIYRGLLAMAGARAASA